MTFITFPLYPIDETKHCTCYKGKRCNQAGKHPIPEEWQNLEVPVDVPEGAGTGVQCGARSGIFVVDVDMSDRKNGAAELLKLGPLPSTRTIRTPTGGVHLYFKHPGFKVRNSVSKLCPGVDIRGDGGFVVGPGSPHKNGGIYTVVNEAEVAEAPEWLLSWPGLHQAPKKEQLSETPAPVDVSTPEGERLVARFTKYLVEEAPIGIFGQGGRDVCFSVVARGVRWYRLPVDVVTDLVLEHWNPRLAAAGSTRVWERDKLRGRVESARDTSQLDWGHIPSAGFDTMLEELSKRPKKAAPGTGAGARRMLPRDGHVYVFAPGDRPNGKKFKISFGTAVAELVQNPAWEGVLQYDEFRKRVYAVNPPMKMDAEKEGLSGADGDSIVCWFEVQNDYLVGGDAACRAAIKAAQHNPYHPVREYLETLPASHEGILDDLSTQVFGTSDDMSNELLKKTLVGAVRRILSPGCQMDTVLVLCGPQGARKTTFVRQLFGQEWTRSQMPDLATKDASQALNGFWAIELAELDRIVRAESSTVKEFLTRTFDDYRPPYGKSDLRFDRQCVFIGTTNEQDFLRDATGNRRFWPINVEKKIDTEYVRKYRDRIWAEAYALALAEYPHWLEEDCVADQVREPFVQEDPWHFVIGEYCKGREQVRSLDVYREAVALGDRDAVGRMSRKELLRTTETLRRIGCKSAVREREKVWLVPEQLKNATPGPEELSRRKAFASVKTFLQN